jgi:hypothetical protein
MADERPREKAQRLHEEPKASERRGIGEQRFVLDGRIAPPYRG